MTFTPKDWRDSPDTTTPITAAALEDLETRLAAWATSLSVPVSHTTRTTNLVTASTTEATGTTVITAPAFTANGVDTYELEFFCPRLTVAANAAGNTCTISIFEGATQIGRIATANAAGTTAIELPIFGKYQLVPTAASHTYTVTAVHNNAACTLNAGAGGTGVHLPMYFRITKQN